MAIHVRASIEAFEYPQKSVQFNPKDAALLLLLWILPGLVGVSAYGDELKPETSAAFERYIGATEARMGNDIRLNQFLVVDGLPDSQRQEAYDRLHRGQIYIEELHAEEDHHPFSIPNGLIHHWIGDCVKGGSRHVHAGGAISARAVDECSGNGSSGS